MRPVAVSGGFSLLEVLLVQLILATGMLALVNISSRALQHVRDAELQTRLSLLAESLLEYQWAAPRPDPQGRRFYRQAPTLLVMSEALQQALAEAAASDQLQLAVCAAASSGLSTQTDADCPENGHRYLQLSWQLGTGSAGSWQRRYQQWPLPDDQD